MFFTETIGRGPVVELQLNKRCKSDIDVQAGGSDTDPHNSHGIVTL